MEVVVHTKCGVQMEFLKKIPRDIGFFIAIRNEAALFWCDCCKDLMLVSSAGQEDLVIKQNESLSMFEIHNHSSPKKKKSIF